MRRTDERDNEYYAMNLTPVVIDGVPIEMLIDSGACVNVLDNASFNKRGSHH